MSKLDAIWKVKKPIIGMVHLRPLPGSPMYDPSQMDMKKILEIAVEEAKMLEDCGVDGVQVENMWDIPYIKGDEISRETTAALALGVHEVMKNVKIPVGVECHMNGGDAAVAVAAVTGARWIRIFEWCNAFISQAGYIEAVGGKLARKAHDLRVDNLVFLCDVNVKHGSHFIIHDRSVAEQAMDIEAQNGDAVIVTGFDTGMPPSRERILECKAKTSLPVFLGSGLSTSNVADLLGCADGAIVGSFFKKDNNWKNELDSAKIRGFMAEVNKLRI